MDRGRESVGVGLIGGALGVAVGGAAGVPMMGALVGAANGALSGWRRVYDWSSRRGVVAFALDSTWAQVTTAAGLIGHAYGWWRGDAGYAPTLSERQNRHVYRRGLRFRRGFVMTLGNVVTGAGDVSQPRRARLVTDHEDVHIWQARWLGPLFPILYGGWMAGGAIGGAAAWLVGGRRTSLERMVESAAYYLNPFEYWAYSRDGNWPPPGLVPGLGPLRPAVRALRSIG